MAAYRPGQGLVFGSAENLRERQEASQICEVCGERTEDAGLNCAAVDDSGQWDRVLGGNTGSAKKARCSECTKPLPENHDPALGPFCPACARSRGQPWIAEAPSAAVAKAARFAGEGPVADYQFGHLIRPGVCKRCKEERREREREEANAKKNVREKARSEALDEGILESPEPQLVSLPARPFGMTPSRAGGEGYLVAKVSEGKPAAQCGVRPGWRVAGVAGAPCEGLDLEAVQALLKAAELPVSVTFEKVPKGGEFCIACQQILVWAQFSRKMLTKPPEKRRCISCTEAAGAGDEAEDAVETSKPAPASGPAPAGRGQGGGAIASGGRGRGGRR